MNHTDQTALWEVCSNQWTRLMSRWSTMHLPKEEWNDIRSVAFIRVFNRASSYDPDKGSPETWARTVMHRSIMNSLRTLVPNKRFKDHEWRTHIQRARPISTSVKQTGRWGEEVVVVEPDMIDESSVSPYMATRWNDFLAQLDSDQRRILRQRMRGVTVTDIHKRFYKHKGYQQVLGRLHDIRKRWKEYCL